MMQQTLSHYFGYETFRPGQEEIISKVLDHRNVLGVLPTGGGKSICYQVPGLLLGGTTIVISPLISLMKRSSGSIKSDGNSSCFFK
ncbi:DEAD/DEAH box helicase [Staphylococcus aureus]|nr:DEAD/DEAH box helicase [Staphylococcus aureus]